MKQILSLLVLVSLPVHGGGFYLNVKPLSATQDRLAADTAFVVFLAGCSDAEKGTVTAVAENGTDGRRQRLSLPVGALSRPGWFAVRGADLSKGNWSVTVIGKHPTFDVLTVAIVPVVDGKVAFERVKHEHRKRVTNASQSSMEPAVGLPADRD